jgi:hypothetical protein
MDTFSSNEDFNSKQELKLKGKKIIRGEGD